MICNILSENHTYLRGNIEYGCCHIINDYNIDKINKKTLIELHKQNIYPKKCKSCISKYYDGIPDGYSRIRLSYSSEFNSNRVIELLDKYKNTKRSISFENGIFNNFILVKDILNKIDLNKEDSVMVSTYEPVDLLYDNSIIETLTNNILVKLILKLDNNENNINYPDEINSFINDLIKYNIKFTIAFYITRYSIFNLIEYMSFIKTLYNDINIPISFYFSDDLADSIFNVPDEDSMMIEHEINQFDNIFNINIFEYLKLSYKELRQLLKSS